MSELESSVIEAFLYIVFALFISMLAKILLLVLRKKHKEKSSEEFLKIEKKIWQCCIGLVVLATGFNLFQLH